MSNPIATSNPLHPGETDDNSVETGLMRYHPVIGYQYNPGKTFTKPRPDGGQFELRVNSVGIRSDREYSLRKPAGVQRILVFGDSQSDGLYQSNSKRFTELIEGRNPGLEVINFSLPGSGTDQQLLTFEEVGDEYERDVVVLFVFLMNIRRNLNWSVPSLNVETGRVIIRPKPRFVLETREDGSEVLELRNVPIPPPGEQLKANGLEDPELLSKPISPVVRGVREIRKMLSPVRLTKNFVYPTLRRLHLDPFPLLGRLGYDAFPEYSDPNSEEWRLMAAILRRFAKATGDTPFVIAPLFNSSYMRFSVGRNYWDRFRSLADGEKTFVIDLLPHFLKLGDRAIKCFFEPQDSHMSDLGHEVMANAVEAELGELGLISNRPAGVR
jgi:hypothetical protein